MLKNYTLIPTKKYRSVYYSKFKFSNIEIFIENLCISNNNENSRK